MYNKYTGILRLFGFLDRVSDYQTIAVELSFDSPNGTNDLNYSSILSLNSGFAQSLTQLTKVKKATVTTKYPNNQNLFFWTDFPMNYDPCVCKFRSHLRVRFKAIQSGTINLEGSIIGTITPIAATDADGKFKMIIRKATAALTSLATAAAGDFKGALNFSSVIDLLDLIGTGNLSQDDKDAIATLKNMLNLGLNFYNASQSEKNSVKEGLTAVNTFVASQFKSASSSASSLVATAKLQGTLETRIDFDGDAISFATPGSYQSELNPDENINNTLDQFGNKLPEYALFNERLGTFSILQPPSMIVQKTTVPPPPEVYDPNTWYLNGITRFRISNHFLSTFYKSYFFNPLMNPNYQNTKIDVALVAKLNPNYPPFLGLETKNARRVGNNEWVSSLVPLQYGDDLVVELSFINGNPVLDYFIRYTIEFESNDLDRNGVPNHSILIFTFPVPEISNYNNQQFNVVSVSEILQTPKPPIQPLSNDDLKLYFCNEPDEDNPVLRYRAKWADPTAPQSANTSDEILETSPIEIKDFSIFTYPNPFNGIFNINIKTPQTKKLSVTVYNINGQKIFQKELNHLSAGTYQQSINLEYQPKGVYIVVVKSGSFIKQQKLIKL